jgi:hypothetical protein
MKPARRVSVILAAALAALPALGAAQELVASFDQLNTRLGLGDTVWVTDAQGREIQGTIERITADTLTLNGSRTLGARDVSLIRHREYDSLKNGTLIGLGIGGGLALAWCVGAATDDSPRVNTGVECTEGVAVFGGLSTLLGLAIDAAMRKMRLVYRSAGVPGASNNRSLSTRLVVTPRPKSVAVSLSF